jgi:hypothetical protein
MAVRAVRNNVPARVTLAALSASALLASLLAAAPAPAAAECTTAPMVMPAAQIGAGMIGTGLTTVQGSTPTSFNIEVIGTLDDAILPGHDLVMFEITGPQSFLDQAYGMFFGMSGSPIFINGMLAGAASYRFYFSDAVIGLFTPAEEMTRIVEPVTSMPSSVTLTTDARRAVARTTGTPLAETPATAQMLRTPLAVSGMSGEQLDELQASLDERGLPIDVVASGSPTAALDPTPLAPGSPMGAAISLGDVSWVGIGTATFVCGSGVNVGFGHPFFFSGSSAMAMTDAEVLTILNDPSGIYGPGMIATPGDIHGTVLEDRFTGIAGQAGPAPDAMLITSDYTNADTGNARLGQTDVYYQEDWWAPDLAWYHNEVNLEVVFDQFGPGSLDLAYTIEGVREDGTTPFTVTNSILLASPYSAFDGIYKMTSAMYTLAFNRFEGVTFTSVDTVGTVTEQRLEGEITGVRTASDLQPSLRSRGVQKVPANGTVTVEVTIDPLEPGAKVRVFFELRAGGRSGYDVVKIRGGREQFYVNKRGLASFEELIEELSGGSHANEIVAKGLGKAVIGTDLMVKGKESFTVKVIA